MNIIYKIKLYLHLLIYRGLKEKFQYSQNGEDLFLIEYFKDVSKGHYIDIGAFHPFRSSNTYKLYKKGWSGINIDLSKKTIDLFELARPKDINLNLAVSDKKKKITIYQNKDMSKWNTINAKWASMYLKNPILREVDSDTLNNILENYNFKSNNFHLINIDAEGSELSILKNIDFDKYKFKLILTGGQYTEDEQDEVVTLLNSKNYKYLKSISDTDIFANKNYSY
ncbi:MAG: Methyltransferase FkbM domain-containing protein [Pelagibacterales bacterium]|nr:Methyltransferase FkbM domain-containing protein [Pelagibacterales bacterium]